MVILEDLGADCRRDGPVADLLLCSRLKVKF